MSLAHGLSPRKLGGTFSKRENKTYRDLPIEEDVLIEILMDSKKKELEIALSKIPDDLDYLIQQKPKSQISKSDRGSKYRGVSRNGKKW